MKKQFKLYQGDNMESLRKLPDNSIDSVVTDPPYGLSFMGKKWDYDVPSVEFWKEVYRVLKPGGHILSFGGTRTYHRMVVNLEDGGFEIRDQVMWLYGSGFPKSHNIGKAVDKIEGNEREVVGERKAEVFDNPILKKQGSMMGSPEGRIMGDIPITKGHSKYEGWGTALKPANEPICVARKPISEKTIAKNVIKWGTGGINIDGCRVGTDTITTTINKGPGNNGIYGKYKGIDVENINEGRFPANIIFDEEAGQMLDEMSLGSSRFFYCAKVSKAERNMGLDLLEGREVIRQGLAGEHNNPIHKNIHTTVKPITLMSYLIKLVTPVNGIILDPFMGSGSTGIAAQLNGFRFCGMEMDTEYFKIAEARIENYEMYRKFLEKKKKK